ncbi:MAG: RNA polymerase sigma factor [Candidatus Saccharimonadales bacterium]
MNEVEIINDIKKGIDRYEELVRRYHIGLIIHCERLVGDRQDAEDIAQDAFVKAYLAIRTFDPKKARFSTWLYRIATNTAMDFLRKHKRKIYVKDIELVAEVTMPQYAEQEERQEVRRAVYALSPPEYKSVIEAYYWRGKSYAEIATELSVPVNTVRTWLHRAKMKLKEQLL